MGGSGSAPVGNVPALICGPSLTHHVIVAGQERGIALLGGDDPRPSCRGLHLLFNLLGDGGPAVSVLQSSGDDTGDGLLGRINDTGHTLTAPQLRRADKLRPLDRLEVVELGRHPSALVVALFPQRLKDIQQGRVLLGPVDEAQGKGAHKAGAVCLAQRGPRRRALLRRVLAVRVIAGDGPHENVPNAPLILGGAAHGVTHPAALLPQILEGGNLKALGLLPLSLQQGALCGLHLEVFTLFRGRTLRGHDFYALRAVSRPL